MQGADLNGRRITVDFSKREKPREPTPGKYLGKVDLIKVRKETHLFAGHAMIGNHVLGRILDLLVVPKNEEDITTRSAADTKGLAQDQTLTKNAGQATRSHLADDLYTKPNPNIYQLQLINPNSTHFQLYFNYILNYFFK
jgi:hypothetical protein